MICFSVIVISCGTSKKVTVSSKPEDSNAIVFLNYKLKKLPDGMKQVELINQKVVEGKLKKRGFDEETNDSESLVCAQYDKNGEALNKMIVENPLRKTLEFVDNQKRLKTTVLDLEEAYFSVRIQLYPKTKYVLIKNFSEDITFIKTKINP